MPSVSVADTTSVSMSAFALSPSPQVVALQYAQRGWAVFPVYAAGLTPDGQPACTCPDHTRCGHSGKHPHTPKGLYAATTNPKQIRRWWTKHALDNIGIATGKVSGLLVLDVDLHHGGDAALATLTRRYGPLPETRCVQSGGGGFHAYFVHPGDQAYRTCRDLDGLKGIDVRADGGYIVAPPSRHASGSSYRWEDEQVPLAPAPAWLLDLLRQPTPQPASATSATSTVPPTARPLVVTESVQWVPPPAGGADYWLHKYVGQAQVGTRNEYALRLARQLRDSARLTLNEAKPFLLAYQQQVDSPEEPFTAQEALATLRSMYRRPPGEPARRRAVVRPQDEPFPDTPPDEQQVVRMRQAGPTSTGMSPTTDLLLDGGRDPGALWVPNYHEDRAVRHALLGGDWISTEQGWHCSPLRKMSIVLPCATPTTDSACAERDTPRFDSGVRILLTLRLSLAYWLAAQRMGVLDPQGRVFIPAEAILNWRGRRREHPGSTGHRRTDGRRQQDFDEVQHDYAQAALLQIYGKHEIWRHGQRTEEDVSGPYVQIEPVWVPARGGSRRFVGVWFAPGHWMETYFSAKNQKLTLVDRRIFALHPRQDKYALYVALFLVERWRMQAHSRTYAEPITMGKLLEESALVDQSALTGKHGWKKRLTDRIIPGVEQALEQLYGLGILGSFTCLDTIDVRSGPSWGEEWLASRWCFLPPASIRAALDKAAEDQAAEVDTNDESDSEASDDETAA